MKRLSFLILSLISASVFTLRAEMYYYFDHVTTKDGLPSNTIYCTLQDRTGFMWVGTRDGLSRYDGNSFSHMRDMVSENGIGGNIYSICEDTEGKIWFSNPSGIHIYNVSTGKLQSLGESGDNRGYSMLADPKGRVWVITDGLIRFDCASLERKDYSFENARPSYIAIDSYGTIWVSMHDGSLYSYDSRTDSFEKRTCEHRIRRLVSAESGKLLATTAEGEVMYLDCITLKPELLYKVGRGNSIMSIIERTAGECWIGTQQGLFIRKSGTDYNGSAMHDAATPESISADYITSLGKDRTGNVWVGTYYRGLNIWKNREDEMAFYFNNPTENSIKGKIVRSICQDNNGHIWFCTEDGWLNRYNPTDQTMKNYKLAENLNLQGLIIDGDMLWVCSLGDGMYLFDIRNERVRKRYDLRSNMASVGIRSRSGQIFAGTVGGLFRYDKADDSFSLVEGTGRDFVHSLYQDSKGVIWIGTYGNGLKCIDENGKLISNTEMSDTEAGSEARLITSFYEDSRHRMWITTEGGGVYVTEPDYKVEALKFSKLTTDDGLPSNVACATAEDQDGMIWISTTKGIVSLSGDSLSVTEMMNGSTELTGYQFSYSATCTARNGAIYFGNTDGMVSIVPSKMKNRSVQDNLVITDILARNTDRSFSLCEDGKTAMVTDYVEVKHKDAASIHLSFVAPEYTTRNPLYTYSISRRNKKEFSGTTYSNSLMFTGLRPGRYTFDIGIAGKEDIPECNRSLYIHIKAHPMLSTAAVSLYILLIIGGLAGLSLLIGQKRKRDKARQLAKITTKKEKEIYNAKINFFTNITHEIRTPLTLIKMPVDKIIASGAFNSSNEKDLRMIQANTDRLLNLTNQLLDMRKMENNEISMSFVKEDICAIVKKAERMFEQMAAEQHITINSEIPDTPIYIMCAKDSVFSIISNLLSNAIKYGNGLINTRLFLSEDQQSVTIAVQSNGEMIPERDRENIFKLFFQREGAEKGVHGTGIGLPYARTLANMHNGKLYLDENVSDMNSFVLELPVKQAEQITIEHPQEETAAVLPEFDSSRHSILIVEDSSEMRNYLAKELSTEYNILTAANGADALEIAHKEKIDLVISDIMMPIMDGCELCNRIKSDSNLSHVPVILLTAAVGVETRIETLESGADGYIEKPFPIELLRSNVSNLFRNKEISYKQFISKPLTHYNSLTSNKVDQEYMDKIHDFIMKHISEPDLNIENLTLQIGTSKSSLYRKLKANTGLSINEYIRLCRLKQAAELLSSQKYKINEVAFMTGFSSPSYFATCFLKQFNITPSEFVKNLGQ